MDSSKFSGGCHIKGERKKNLSPGVGYLYQRTVHLYAFVLEAEKVVTVWVRAKGVVLSSGKVK